MTRTSSILLLTLGMQVAAAGEQPDRPNFLIIMADDCTFNDLPVYGGQNAQTPNIDALAERGLTFNRAYLASSMCQPCRAELYSGQFPMRNGCAWNHSASRPQTKSLPHFLRPLGYRVGLAGKVHVEPDEAFPFDSVPGFDPSCTRAPTKPHSLAGIRQYMSAEQHDDPFCLVVALVEPHVPWVMGDASQYPPAKIKLPPNLADTPLTRELYAAYLAEITYMDSQVGEILSVLQQSGAENNTLVLFTSEQGSQFPGCKWTNWDTGVHTALIASWPGNVARGRRTDAIVQYVDVASTLVQLAGGEPPQSQDGWSFAGVLRGEDDQHRTYAYGMHNQLPEGPRYPIRSITDGKVRYIRNLLPDELFIEKHLMSGRRINDQYWGTWLAADPLHERRTYELVKRYMLRPAEQLYLTSTDPYELTNVVDDERHAAIKLKLSQSLDEWLTSQNDPGAAVDTVEALEAARRGNHLYGKKSDSK